MSNPQRPPARTIQRRSFLGHTARLFGGAVVLGPGLLAACGGDDDDDGATATSGVARTTPSAAGTTATSGAPGTGGAAALGTVRTAFNWVPDVEWAAWYLADANGLLAGRGVTAEYVHGGPNTPAVAQVLAAGDADVGVASDELQLIQANKEGADFVILGAMYQRSPNGFCWLAETPISTAADLVGKRLGLTTGDEIRVDAVFKVNGLEPDYETVQMSFDPQPLIDGDADAITCYVTNQPIQLQLQGIPNKSAPYSDFGLKAFGDVLFASKAWVADNRDLLVAYFAGLLAGVEANVADPTAVLPLLSDVYGKDADIDLEYSEAGNPAYIALLDSDYTEANGRLQIDPAYLQDEVYPSYEAAGETDLPPVEELLDATVMADAHAAG
jgi:ABC-type nitrate/sulfonate/bicarbonate transport system substrate-binding protein